MFHQRLAWGYVGYSAARGLIKAACNPRIETERSNNFRGWPSLYPNSAEFAGEYRQPLLLERAVCVLTSPTIGVFHLAKDASALEVLVRGEDPWKFSVAHHPLFNKNTYKDVEEFWMA